MKIPVDEADEEIGADLTPMIDVVFLLLIFFMVATTFLDPERELDVDLPEAESGEPIDQGLDEIVINVRRDGTIVLNGEEVATESLRGILTAAARENPDVPVTIRGDRRTHHENIVAVMDACGQAGLVSLAIGTAEDS